MKVIRTAEFEKSLSKLPANIRRLCAIQEQRFLINLKDPRLHLKKLHLPDPIYSFRVTRSYRGLFYFDLDGNIILFDIDSRKDIYR
jgi:mRNA-degrading endonuclease RelE of RelBE toxin-antitoxin system